MDVEEFNTKIKGRLSYSFSDQHLLLLQICFGNVKPCVKAVAPLNESLDARDMSLLHHMVQVEFAAALEKEKMGCDTTVAIGDDRKPYDVYLMHATLDRQHGDRRRNIAVVLPMRGSRALAWYDGGSELYELEFLSAKWKIASLSGSARVLEALKAPAGCLTSWAMQREMLQLVERNQSVVSDADHSECQHLNASQRQAVATVASPAYAQGFFCVQGPPGTGKTTCAVAMISAARRRGRGLVTAPSNAAVANIALKVFATRKYSLAEFVVYGENCDSSVRHLNPKFRGDEFGKLCQATEDLEKKIVMTESEADAEKLEKHKALLHEQFIEWLDLDRIEVSMAELSVMCPTGGDDKNGRFVAACLEGASVAFCTLNQAGSGLLRNSFNAATLVLDEAGQTPESDFYIATTFPGVARIIAIGDPQQLPSTVISPDCASVGFGVSWLEKVQRLCPNAVHLLDTQYRMDPQILRFPNQSFYRSRIQSGDSVFGREPFVERPFLFVDTDRRGKEDRDDFSFMNTYEAVVIKSLLKTDSDIVRVIKDNPMARIIVITPYRSQVKLLKESLKGLRHSIDVATVDAFQGQEGDIVLLSTVRTQSIGFVDSKQRLCVALTRAKRILRVIGDRQFFLSLKPGSTLRSLCQFADSVELLRITSIRAKAWSPPNWNIPTIWKPVMNARFSDCLQKLISHERNVALNTVLAIATADDDALDSYIPQRSVPGWYLSYLKGYSHLLNVVWIAKEGQDLPIIEAHFVGGPAKCRKFIQENSSIPRAVFARTVKKCMSGLENVAYSLVDQSVSSEDRPILSHPLAAWPLNSLTQKAVLANTILPIGTVQLDPHQERIAHLSPPLLVESRSGTGKTLVLLQHVAYHSEVSSGDSRFPCFVTVSPRLCKRLEQDYMDMQMTSNHSLPEVCFVTYHDLLARLANWYASDLVHNKRCTFSNFIRARKSHHALPVEPHLIENEIGGVIMGSLEAVLQSLPLSRDQYLSTKRSNVENKSSAGLDQRNTIYDAFHEYAVWKRENGLYDNNDLILRLLSWLRLTLVKDPHFELFSAAYLDEVQDLSYASIFLICSLAGRTSSPPRWVCAGDPAQMISPGCSFSFDGLKQILLAIRPETRHKDVVHLLVNYRTTKDVLELANAILSVAKRDFPGSIGFAQPEIAQKDLHYKVVLCCWEMAFSVAMKLGPNQALLYSGQDDASLKRKVMDWTDCHPFVLSILESKGLEFDDIIVVFDLERKAWDTAAGRVQSLRMLRELYVAVTRGRRRVVILVPKRTSAMWNFFEALDYTFQTSGAELILQEFHKETSPAEWKKKGQEMFDDAHYEVAASCFEAAGDIAWSQFAQARHLLKLNDRTGAETACGNAIEKFFAQNDFKEVVRLAVLADGGSCWPCSKTEQIVQSLDAEIDVIDRPVYVRMSVRCGNWKHITITDFQASSMSRLWLNKRGDNNLLRILRSACAEDLDKVDLLVPALVGDHYFEKGLCNKAVDCYLRAHDTGSASSVIRSLIDKLEQRDLKAERIPFLAETVEVCLERPFKTGDEKVNIFLNVVKILRKRQGDDDGQNEEELHRVASKCMKYLSRTLVLWLVEYAKADRVMLFYFDSTLFVREVTDALILRFRNQVEVVRWFLSKGSAALASDFARKRLESWNNSQIILLVLLLKPSSDGGWEWLCEKVYSGRLTTACVLAVAGSQLWTVGDKKGFALGLSRRAEAVASDSDIAKKGKKTKAMTKGFLLLEQWCLDFLSQTANPEAQRDEIALDKIRCLSDNNLDSIIQQLRSLNNIIGAAEQEHFDGRPRAVFSAIFQEIDRRNRGSRLILSMKNMSEAEWLLGAFVSYEIPLYVSAGDSVAFLEFSLTASFSELYVRVHPADYTTVRLLHEAVMQDMHENTIVLSSEKYISLLSLTLQAGLSDVAAFLHAHNSSVYISSAVAMNLLRLCLDLKLAKVALSLTWQVFESQDAIEAHLPAVLDLWMGSATEDMRVDTFSLDYTHQSIVYDFLIRNQFAKDVHISLFDVFNYGPAVARCLRRGIDEKFDATVLRLTVEFERELRLKISGCHVVAEDFSIGKSAYKKKNGKGKPKPAAKLLTKPDQKVKHLFYK